MKSALLHIYIIVIQVLRTLQSPMPFVAMARLHRHLSLVKSPFPGPASCGGSKEASLPSTDHVSVGLKSDRGKRLSDRRS